MSHTFWMTFGEKLTTLSVTPGCGCGLDEFPARGGFGQRNLELFTPDLASRVDRRDVPRDQVTVTQSAPRRRPGRPLRGGPEAIRPAGPDPGGRGRKRCPFHGEFRRTHGRHGQLFRWCPFCSSLQTNHQSTKAVKPRQPRRPRSVFNWLTSQVNSI